MAGMSSVASIAMSGMHAAVQRLEASATRVARATIEPSPEAGGTGARAESRVDYAGEAVEQMVAGYEFTANALVLRTHSRMMQALFDKTV
jgi:flagellar basal body rod protein FlgC